MRENLVAVAIVMVLALFVADVFSKNALSRYVHDLVSYASYPLFLLRRTLEDYFAQTIVHLDVSLFGVDAQVHRIVSVDAKGYHALGVHRKGIAIDPLTKRLVGFVERTGAIGYVVKWWESEFPVSVQTKDAMVVGYYKNLKIEVPENLVRISGKVYVADIERYGRLLREHNFLIGTLEEGVFKPAIDRLSGYIVVLEDYDLTQTESGGK